VTTRDRAALVAGRLLIAEEWMEREVAHAEVPITHLTLRRLVDCSDLLDSFAAMDSDAPGSDWVEWRLGHADEVRRPEPSRRDFRWDIAM
jgi:error-prone DNA polymerase